MTVRRLARPAVLFTIGILFGAAVFKGENFLERLFIDLRFFIVSSLHVQDVPSDRVAIVAMDNRSEEILKVRFGSKWRQFHPTLLEKLTDAGASLIVFDSKFLDEEPQWDAGFAQAVKSAGNVIAGEDEPFSTIASLRGAFLAIGDLRWKALGNVPRFVGLSDDPAAMRPLSVVAIEQYARRSGTPGPDARFRRSPGFWIDFRNEPSSFFSFSYADVVRAAEGRMGNVERTAMSVFKDKIVLIGLDDRTSQADRFVFPNTMLRQYPGVYGQAYAVETVLDNAAVSRPSPWVDGALTAAFLVVLLLALEIRARKTRTIVLAALPAALFILETVLLSAANLWLGYAPLITAFAAVLLVHWIGVRLTLASSLSRAMGFDPHLMEAFRRESARLGGPVRKDVTILIADVRGYTAYVSSTDSAIVSRVMAEYMAAMERCITGEGGYINKYVGDEIIAVFGFPLAAEASAERAARAAIAMRGELSALAAAWREQGIPCIERIGIGVDTGHVVFAEIGGRTKSQFDIIGDCINGASRIEHLTKDMKRTLLISEEVYRGIEKDDSLSGSFGFLKTVAIRGQGSRRIYGLIN
jgi:class 3 adenylate cyclase/CHASE2 domain-containing sensor protein